MRPSLISGSPIRAVRAASRNVQASANSSPPPKAYPLISAIDGIGSASSLAKVVWPKAAPSRWARSDRPISSLMSAPTENARSPAPVTSSARASPAATWSTAAPRSRNNSKLSAFSTSARSSVMRASSSMRVRWIAIGSESCTGHLLRSAAQRSRMTRQLDTLRGIGQRGAIGSQYPEILIQKVSDINVLPVWAERDTFRQHPDVDGTSVGDPLAVDLEGRDGSCGMIKGSTLRHVRTARFDRDGEIAFWADGESLRRVADGYMIDYPGRVGFEIDDTDRIDVAIRAPAISGISDQRQLAVRRHRNIIGKDPRRQVTLVIRDLLAVYRQ